MANREFKRNSLVLVLGSQLYFHIDLMSIRRNSYLEELEIARSLSLPKLTDVYTHFAPNTYKYTLYIHIYTCILSVNMVFITQRNL